MGSGFRLEGIKDGGGVMGNNCNIFSNTDNLKIHNLLRLYIKCQGFEAVFVYVSGKDDLTSQESPLPILG